MPSRTISRGVRRALWLTVAGLLVAALALAAYIRFEYTLVGDLREAIATVDPTDPVAHGRLLFATRGCAGCHTLAAADAMATLGPNLDQVAARLAAPDIRRSILEPNSQVATCGDQPCRAQMPSYTGVLDDTQVDALTAFLQQQRLSRPCAKERKSNHFSNPWRHQACLRARAGAFLTADFAAGRLAATSLEARVAFFSLTSASR